MTTWTKSFRLWLGAATILSALFLATPPVAANGPGDQDGDSQGGTYVPSPEPATLTLLALGGGAVALARYRKSRRNK